MTEEEMKEKARRSAEQRVCDNFEKEEDEAFTSDFTWLLERGFLPAGEDKHKWRKVDRYSGNRPDTTVAVIVTVILDFDKTDVPRFKDEESYEHVLVNGREALFVDGRYDRSLLPEGLYCYDLRGSDEDPGCPATVEKNPVTVNHAGCVIFAGELDFPEEGFVPLEEWLDYLEEDMSSREFWLKTHQRDVWKWRAGEVIKDEGIPGVDDTEKPYCLTGFLSDTPFEALVSMFEQEELKELKEVKGK